MTLSNRTSKWVATTVAAMLLGTACGGTSDQADGSPAPTGSVDARADGSELAGVQLDVRRDPG